METITVKSTTPWFKADSKWPRWIRLIENRIRTRIFGQPRYLIDVWRVEKSGEIHCEHHPDLEKELIKTLASSWHKDNMK